MIKKIKVSKLDLIADIHGSYAFGIDSDNKNVKIPLSGIPTLEQQASDLSQKKADKVSGATAGNFSALDASGNLVDSLTKPSDFEPADESILRQADVVDSLTSESATAPLSAKQGKKLQDEITQLAGEVSLLDAVQVAKIKDIESIISTMNPNQSAQLSVSGRKTISLPKNAANGGMSVKMEGLTAENLIANGDFRDGLTKWSGLSVSLVLDNGKLIAGNWTQLFSRIRVKFSQRPAIGDKLYLLVEDYERSAINSANNLIMAKINDTGTPLINIIGSQDLYFPILSGIAEYEGQETLWIEIRANQKEGDTVSIGKTRLINLTATFGAGKEPSKEQCDLMFSDYFEGVKSFEPTGRVRSVGKNLLFGSINTWEQGTFVSNVSDNGKEITFGDNRIRSKIRHPVTPNKTYVVSVSSDYEVWALQFDENNVRIDGIGAYYSQNIVLNTLPNTKYIKLTIRKKGTKYTDISPSTLLYNTDIDIIKPQLEQNTVSTPYEPYRETSLYLTAPELRSNGTVKDEIRKGANGYELVKRISEVDGTVLANPVITPISYGGILNSAENGTVRHEPIIADAGVYGTNLPILMQDYPIASIEEIIKYENGIDTYLNVASAVVASDGLSFTHPDLASGDLVLFTYAFDKESTNGNITATFYDSNVVKIDTSTGQAYKIEDVITNGELTRTITEVL